MSPRKGSQTSVTRITARLKAVQALEYRLEGKDYDFIAEHCGYEWPSSAYNAIQSLLSRVEYEHADVLREVEATRLDRMLAGVWAAAQTGDTDAIDTVLKIMKRRSQLLGLDMPAKLEVSGEVRVSRQVILKIGDRAPRIIDLDNLQLHLLSNEELEFLRQIPAIEGEYEVLG